MDFEQTSTNPALIENRKDLTGGLDEQVDSVVAATVDLTSSPVKFGTKALRLMVLVAVLCRSPGQIEFQEQTIH